MWRRQRRSGLFAEKRGYRILGRLNPKLRNKVLRCRRIEVLIRALPLPCPTA
ncbi:hypothetical protein EJ03DRAFT_327533 [Teratosphaeria nubilosa]|uniref:Uncharacterized protein n=1 Tax=Teratosphaeria nubilosa TaxID=161662 RepID=A0A6G1L9L4_9PEZI|nr:hypothetical protein EJ03DRAFT_327533 [Teratosphaeria nubilosa]